VYFGTQHAFVYLLAYSLGQLCANGMSSLYSKPLLDEIGKLHLNYSHIQGPILLWEHLLMMTGLEISIVTDTVAKDFCCPFKVLDLQMFLILSPGQHYRVTFHILHVL